MRRRNRRSSGVNGIGAIVLLLLLLLPILPKLLLILFNFLLLTLAVAVLIIVFISIVKYLDYKNSSYHKITKLPYREVKYDMGKYGEYLTYKQLKKFEKKGAKLLFNLYIPKENGETTEIDVLMISPEGIFVFESKNYSGFIFGDEDRQNWCQTLPTGRRRSHKEYFYNPIMQNRSHIRHLDALLDIEVPIWSIIVFSDRCTLKSITIRGNDVDVVNLRDVKYVVYDICNQTQSNWLTEEDIEYIYDKLYPYTQVDEDIREQHIENIYNNLNQQTENETATPVAPIAEPKPITDQVIEKFEDESVVQIKSETVEIKNYCKNATTETTMQKSQEPQILKCPRCNGKLVLRTATKGAHAGNKFYGCSNYPQCKYIQNITNNTMTFYTLQTILLTPTPSSLLRANEAALFSLIPELEACKGFNQNSPWHIYDVYDHILKVVDLVPCNPTARFTALFHDVGKPPVYHEDENGVGHFYGHWEKSAEIFARFAREHELDESFAADVSKLIFYHDVNFAKLAGEERDFVLKKFTAEEIELLFAIKRADLLAQNPKYHGLLADYDVQREKAGQRLCIIKAHELSANNKAALLRGEKCGCYHFLKIFRPQEITQWLCEGDGTAVCPYCGVDSVIGESAGCRLDEETLREMHEFWF